VVASALAASPTRFAVAVAALSGAGCQKECAVELTTPDPLPDGRVGQAYFVQMTVTGECVRDGAYWLAEGAPPGMKLSRDGALDGTPTAAGTYTVTISAGILDIYGDYKGTPQDIRNYSLTILPR
jgi:hypothetical protein